MTHGRKKLLGRARDLIRVKHYSIHTEQTYLHWIKQFILYHNKRQGDAPFRLSLAQ
jgi:hypothetical protein